MPQLSIKSLRFLAIITLALVGSCRFKQSTDNTIAAKDVDIEVVALGHSSKYQTLIYQNDAIAIFADLNPSAKVDHELRSELFVANFSNPIMHEAIRSNSALRTYYQKGNYAVFRSSDLDAVEQISAHLHRYGTLGQGIGCGSVSIVAMAPLVTTKSVAIEAQNFRNTRIPELEPVIKSIRSQDILKIINELSNLGSRKYNTEKGIQASNLVKSLYEERAKGRSDIKVSEFSHSAQKFQQKSIITRIEGKKDPSKTIIIGSHLDSINLNGQGGSNGGQQSAPGADDNASGTATALEVFRAIVDSNLQFEYSIEFHAYAAEEPGLLGSMEIANQYKAQSRNVIGMMQLDMTGYSVNKSTKQIVLISNQTHSNLTAEVKNLSSLYLSTPAVLGRMTSGSSDHESWTRAGFPAVFPFEDPQKSNPYIHTTNDIAAHLDPEFSAEFGKLALAFVFHKAILSNDSGGVNPNNNAIYIQISGNSPDSASLNFASTTRYHRYELCIGERAQCEGSNSQKLADVQWLRHIDGISFYGSGQFDPRKHEKKKLTFLGYDTNNRVMGSRTFELISRP